MFLKRKMNDSTNSYSDKILQIKEKIRQADAVIVGAGAGLSTAAGFVYTGDRFTYYFSDFEKKYGFSDMYSGGFYPYATLEEHWAYWSRYICSHSCLYYHFITPSFITIHSVHSHSLSQVYSSFRISPISSFMQTDFLLISSGAYASPWFRHT